jgi:oxalate decarboxylase/phosphoglucose isomerase-like protein (cupin superfamily)
MPELRAVDPNAVPTQAFDWGAIKWLVTPDNTEGAGLTFGEVRLMPRQGHARHNHPESEEILYVLSGEGEQMLEADGSEHWFRVKAGDCIYVPTGMFHSTVNRGWEPLRLLALYNPGGAEKALQALPDFREIPAGQDAGWKVGS